MPPPPHPSRSPAQDTMAQMYTTHPSFTMESPERFTFPSPPRHASSGRRISTSEHRLKPGHSETPPTEYPFSPSQRRSSTSNAMIPNPYDSRPHHMKSPEPSRSRQPDNRFPGPLRIPPEPRFLDSPSPSPHDSPASTLIGTPNTSHQPFRSPSPTLLPSWRDSGLSQKLPPILHVHPSSRHNLPQLTSARWNDNPYTLNSSPRFQETPSPTPSSPDSEGVAHRFLPSSPRYDYPSKSESSTQRRDPTRHGDEPWGYRKPDFDEDADEYVNKDHFSGRYAPVQDTERRHSASSQRRSSISTPQPTKTHSTSESPYHNPYESGDYNEVSQLGSGSRLRSKFGVRRGSRFFCTYVSPLTGERCDIWDKGWTVYATLSRHAETEHGPEELALMARGELSYDQAQVITTREKRDRIEENLAQTGFCPDCGTMFSSKRRDSLSRHRQTSACEKAQKRGRPPTKFPKKPKGSSFQISEVDSSGETP